MTSIRSRVLHFASSDITSLRSRPQRGSDAAADIDIIDLLLRRTDRALDDSIEAVRRLRSHTQDTDQQIESSRAFLADSYHTLDVLRRERKSRS